MKRDKLKWFTYKICEVKMDYGARYVGWLVPYHYNKRYFEVLTLDGRAEFVDAKSVEDVQPISKVKYEYEYEAEEDEKED